MGGLILPLKRPLYTGNKVNVAPKMSIFIPSVILYAQNYKVRKWDPWFQKVNFGTGWTYPNRMSITVPEWTRVYVHEWTRIIKIWIISISGWFLDKPHSTTNRRFKLFKFFNIIGWYFLKLVSQMHFEVKL